MSGDRWRIDRQFVPLVDHFVGDPAIHEVGAAAEAVYVRSLVLSRALGLDGIISTSNLRQIDWGIHSMRDVARRLLDAGLWLPGGSRESPTGLPGNSYESSAGLAGNSYGSSGKLPGSYEIRSWFKYNRPAAEVREAKEQARAGEANRSRNYRNRKRDRIEVPVTQSSRVTSRSLEQSRVEQSSERTPSGSVRSELARDAPRSAPEGATRHAQQGAADAAPADVVASTESENRLSAIEAKKQIDALIANSRMGSGKPTKIIPTGWSATERRDAE